MIEVDKVLVTETINKYGSVLQTVVAIEELSELQKELCKSLRHKPCKGHVVEELADVMIMAENIKQIFGINDEEVNNLIFMKQSRTIERMKSDDGIYNV